MPRRNPVIERKLKSIHGSLDALFKPFKEANAEPRWENGKVPCAQFCPSCASEKRSAKGHHTVIMGYQEDNRRWMWTCMRCRKLGVKNYRGDAIQAAAGFQGKCVQADFLELVNQFSPPEPVSKGSAIEMNMASPQNKPFQLRYLWGQRLLPIALMLLPHECVFLLVAVSALECPDNWRDFANLVVKKTNMLPDTANRIAKRLHDRNKTFFTKLSKSGLSAAGGSAIDMDARRFYVIFDAVKQMTFSRRTRVFALLLYYSVRKGETVAVSKLAREAKCCIATVKRCFIMSKTAGIFTGRFVNASERGPRKSATVGLQRQYLDANSPGMQEMRRIAASVENAWREEPEDAIGRRRRWGMKRFLAAVKSVSENHATARPAGEG